MYTLYIINIYFLIWINDFCIFCKCDENLAWELSQNTKEFQAVFASQNGFEFEDECKISQSTGNGNGNSTPQEKHKILVLQN